MKKIYFSFKLIGLSLVLGAYCSLALGSSVFKCNLDESKCAVTLSNARLGEYVDILDEKALPAAIGKIRFIKGDFGIVNVEKKLSPAPIKKGYLVIPRHDTNSHNTQWAATFSF